ncbi:MAG TPA: hypothetical protein PKW79_00665 [Rhabdochlamydiaceae bacterium]|nr:hypothetical protein [Rhabdochlamydiaceae bacterium]
MRRLMLPLLLTSFLAADPGYNLICDSHLSPYAGAENLLAAHTILEESKIDQFTMLYRFSPRPTAKVARAGELIFLWAPINYYAAVAQHEVFGHGYRVRNLEGLGACVTNYKFGVPPPYGHGGGVTQFRWYPSKTNAFDKIAITFGGVEASGIFANRIRLQWLKKSQVSPRQSLLYLLSEHDLTRYTLMTKYGDKGDIDVYIQEMNAVYNHGNLSLASLKKEVLVNFLDPFTYYSLFACYKFIINGNEGPLPMLSFGNYRYLPGFRLGLTPFGTEYYAENFLLKDNKPIYFYLRGGQFADLTYFGAGIQYPHLWDVASFSLGFRIDLWNQPDFSFTDPQLNWRAVTSRGGFVATNENSRLGLSCSILAERKLWDSGAFFLQCGFKSEGFVPGEELGASPILRVGITLW